MCLVTVNFTIFCKQCFVKTGTEEYAHTKFNVQNEYGRNTRHCLSEKLALNCPVSLSLCN